MCFTYHDHLLANSDYHLILGVPFLSLRYNPGTCTRDVSQYQAFAMAAAKHSIVYALVIYCGSTVHLVYVCLHVDL